MRNLFRFRRIFLLSFSAFQLIWKLFQSTEPFWWVRENSFFLECSSSYNSSFFSTIYICKRIKGEKADFCTSLYFFVLLRTSLYFLVLLCTSLYFLLLLRTSLYFLVLLVLLCTSRYFYWLRLKVYFQ